MYIYICVYIYICIRISMYNKAYSRINGIQWCSGFYPMVIQNPKIQFLSPKKPDLTQQNRPAATHAFRRLN